MRHVRSIALLAVVGACGTRISAAPGEVTVDASAPTDDAGAATDAPPMLGKWGAPTKVGVAATTAVEDDVTLSSSTLELFFAVNTANGKDLYVTTRASVTGAWTTPTALPFNSATTSDETPRLSADDKTLYFASSRGGNLDIYSVTRPAVGSTMWSAPQAMAINTTAPEKWYAPCGATHYLLVINDAGGNGHLYEGVVGSAPKAITELNSTASETGSFATPDCLTVYFASTRSGTNLLYTAHRTALTQPFTPPTVVTDFAIAGAATAAQEDPWMSVDGRTFAFASDASGTKDVYLSTR